MVKFQQPRGGKVDLTPGFRKSEKLKLILMGAGVVVIGLVALFGLSQANKYRAQADGSLPAEDTEAAQEVVFRPQVDRDKLNALVRESKGADRVMLEPEAVEEIMRSARQMTAASYRDPSIGAREIDAATSATILGDTEAARGEPFFARGWIETIEERAAPNSGQTRYLGRLTLEDESTAFFLVNEKPESTIFGDFVRVNGLFLKHFSDEDPEARGTWHDGPLLVGRAMHRSYPSFGTVEELDPLEIASVSDDDIATGFSGMPFDQLWYLMAYARDVSPAAIDWDTVPEMTRGDLQDIVNNGAAHRYEPVRIPVSSLQSVTVKRAGENPARVDHYTEGWIGNTTWKQVMKYIAPASYRDLARKDLVTARGFFFKNLGYEPRDGGVHVAPVFVLTDMEYYDRPSSGAIRHLGYIIGGTALGLLLFLSVLLTRDKRSSHTLQRRLVERRRARRGGAPA